MDLPIRKNMTATERAEVNEISKSLLVSSYLDNIIDNISSGQPKTASVVPDYSQSGSSNMIGGNESNGLYSMEVDDMFDAVSDGIPLETLNPTGTYKQYLLQLVAY